MTEANKSSSAPPTGSVFSFAKDKLFLSFHVPVTTIKIHKFLNNCIESEVGKNSACMSAKGTRRFSKIEGFSCISQKKLKELNVTPNELNLYLTVISVSVHKNFSYNCRLSYPCVFILWMMK